MWGAFRDDYQDYDFRIFVYDSIECPQIVFKIMVG